MIGLIVFFAGIAAGLFGMAYLAKKPLSKKRSEYDVFDSMRTERMHKEKGHTQVRRTVIDMKMGRWSDRWVDKNGNDVS